MTKYSKPRQYYEDRYDHLTVTFARNDLKYFTRFRDKWFEVMPDEKPDSHRNVFHLNGIYMQMVGNSLLERYDNRDEKIRQMIAEDEAKDSKIDGARLTTEPLCKNCHKSGLRIIDKSLLNRGGRDTPEQVLFMLKCPDCNTNSAYWEDGIAWEPTPVTCSRCQAVMTTADRRNGKVITTTYSCPSCSHTYNEKLDFRPNKDEADPDFEADRVILCLQDPKNLEEHRNAKRRYDGLIQMAKEFKEKEENKHLYDAVARMKKLKIPELTPLLAPILEENGYIEFSLEKPDIGQNVTISFNCLDSKQDREDYESKKALKKLIKLALLDTNWRLASHDISCRLGYLTGQIKAYETEEDLIRLIKRS